MIKVKKVEENEAPILVSCYICHMTMPRFNAFTDGKRILCSACAELEE